MMRELHEGPSGGHFAIKITSRRILDVSYWWPTLYKNVHDYSNLVMHTKERKNWRFKVLQTWSQVF
jgi:hypothetical protein